jgi:hypothetical protein
MSSLIRARSVSVIALTVTPHLQSHVATPLIINLNPQRKLLCYRSAHQSGSESKVSPPTAHKLEKMQPFCRYPSSLKRPWVMPIIERSLPEDFRIAAESSLVREAELDRRQPQRSIEAPSGALRFQTRRKRPRRETT